MNGELKNLIERIDLLKTEIDAMRPLPPDLEGKIMQKFRLDWNFHSNAIEGNSLTYGETIAFLMEGLTAKGKPLKDHLDLRGHNSAVDFLMEMISSEQSLSEMDIRSMHQMILVEPFWSEAVTADGPKTRKLIQLGTYKISPNHVKTQTGEIHYYATPEETPIKMQELVDWYRANENTLHPLLLAAQFHHRFVSIHPFDDGNGRMSRLLMNWILMKKGFPPVVIHSKKELRSNYYAALSQADRGQISVFDQFIGERLLSSMELYLKGANGESIDEPDDLDKEIKLFVGAFGTDLVKKKNDIQTIQMVLSGEVSRLFGRLASKCMQFKDLFFDCTFSYKLHVKHEKNPVEIIELNTAKSFMKIPNYVDDGYNLNEVSFNCSLSGFKKGKRTFTINEMVRVPLRGYDFVIKYQYPNIYWSYRFDDQIQEAQISILEKALVKSIIESITKNNQY